MDPQARYDNALTDVSCMIASGEVSQRVVAWLESGEGYPESFTAPEMEQIYAYARLGRWAWFNESRDLTQAGAPLFPKESDDGGDKDNQGPA